MNIILNRNKKILICVAILIVIALIYFYYPSTNKTPTAIVNNIPPPNSQQNNVNNLPTINADNQSVFTQNVSQYDLNTDSDIQIDIDNMTNFTCLEDD